MDRADLTRFRTPEERFVVSRSSPSRRAGFLYRRMIPPLHDARRARGREMRQTRAALVRWEKPALMCGSDSDPVFPLADGEAAVRLIPSARFTRITGASHFLQEDKGDEIARRILDFVPDRRAW